jgi:hypothetical protein
MRILIYYSYCIGRTLFFAGCIKRDPLERPMGRSINRVAFRSVLYGRSVAQTRSHLGHLEDLCWSCLSVRERLLSAVGRRHHKGEGQGSEPSSLQ